MVHSRKAWYRLAMVDKDGSIRYSAIAAVSIQQVRCHARIYPTIVESNQVFIESNKKVGRVMIELVDMNGRIAQTEQRSLSVGRQSLGSMPQLHKQAAPILSALPAMAA